MKASKPNHASWIALAGLLHVLSCNDTEDKLEPGAGTTPGGGHDAGGDPGIAHAGAGGAQNPGGAAGAEVGGSDGGEAAGAAGTAGDGALAVLDTDPPADSQAAEPTGSIRVTFSRELDPTSVDDASFTVTRQGTPVPGTVTVDGSTLVLTPSGRLHLRGRYEVVVAPDITDTFGVALESEQRFAFTVRDGIWQEPIPIVSDPRLLRGNVQLGIDAEGNVLVAYSELHSIVTGAYMPYARWYHSTIGWGAPHPLLTARQVGAVTSPSLAITVTAEGQAAAVVFANEPVDSTPAPGDTSGAIVMARYRGGEWEAAEVASAPGAADQGYSIFTGVAMHGDTAISWWLNHNLSDHQRGSARWAGDQAPELLAALHQPGLTADLRPLGGYVDSTGGASVVASASLFGPPRRLEAARFELGPSEQQWQSSTLDTSRLLEFTGAPMVFDREGVGMIVWATANDGIYWSRYFQDIGFDKTRGIQAFGERRAAMSHRSVSTDGRNFFAIWLFVRENYFDARDVYAATYSAATGSFSAPVQLSDAGDVRDGLPVIAADTQGNATAVWFVGVFNPVYNSTLPELRTSRYSKDGSSWSEPQVLSTFTEFPRSIADIVAADNGVVALLVEGSSPTADGGPHLHVFQ